VLQNQVNFHDFQNNTSFDAHLVPEISLQLLFKSKDDDKILVSAFNYRFIVGFQVVF